MIISNVTLACQQANGTSHTFLCCCSVIWASPSIDSYAQKQQQMSATTATTQQIYLQQDPEPISNCYGFIQDTVEVREGVDPAPTLNIQRQHIKSKEITRSKLPVSISNFGILPDDVSLKHVRVSAA